MNPNRQNRSLGNKTVRRLRNLEISKTKQIKRLGRRDKARAVAAGEDKWGNPIERAKYEFERRFANTYNDIKKWTWVTGQTGNWDQVCNTTYIGIGSFIFIPSSIMFALPITEPNVTKRSLYAASEALMYS